MNLLYENDVIESVCIFLVKNGFEIVSRCTTTETGDDIVAYNKNIDKYFYIEAKGQTSSKEGSARYNKEFNCSQKKTHVGEALYRALVMKDRSKQYSGIALPQCNEHNILIEAIKPSLKELSIEVFWVKSDKTVLIENFSKVFD